MAGRRRTAALTGVVVIPIVGVGILAFALVSDPNSLVRVEVGLALAALAVPWTQSLYAIWRSSDTHVTHGEPEGPAVSRSSDAKPDRRMSSRQRHGLPWKLDAQGPKVLSQIASANVDGIARAVAFSPDGKLLAIMTASQLSVLNLSDSTHLLDVSRRWAGWESLLFFDCAWDPEGTQIAAVVGGYAGITKMRSFHLPTFAERQIPLSRRATTYVRRAVSLSPVALVALCFAFASDGVHFATGGMGGTRWWHQPSGSLLKHITGAKVWDVAIDPSGLGIIASAGADGAVHLHKMPEGEKLRSFLHELPVRSLAFRHDGELLVSAAGRALHLWDVRTGYQVSSADCSGDVMSVRFDPAGRFIVSGDRSGSVVVWPLAADIQAQAYQHPNEISALALSPDSQVLVTACHDKVLRTFDLLPRGEPATTLR